MIYFPLKYINQVSLMGKFVREDNVTKYIYIYIFFLRQIKKTTEGEMLRMKKLGFLKAIRVIVCLRNSYLVPSFLRLAPNP